MKFRTELTPDELTLDELAPRLELRDAVLVLGSCFAENMGERLARLGVNVTQNPLGIQYNPLSLARTLDYFTAPTPLEIAPHDLFEHHGLYRHWDVHSRLCHATQDETATHITTAIAEGAQAIRAAHWLYLTLGSAHVWRRGERVVANCHRRPQAEFTRELSRVEESEETLLRALRAARALNPGLHVLLTVSPVRYKRDGLVGSQRSKATLTLAAQALVEREPWIHYFPAYELLLDDLRDYRFFARDLVHPSELAVDYIWDHLKVSAFSPALCAARSPTPPHIKRR